MNMNPYIGGMVFQLRRVNLIVILIVLALAGLIVLQSLLLKYAMELKEQAFRRNVMAALGQVSNSVTTGEVMMMAFTTDSERSVSVEATIDDTQHCEAGSPRLIERRLAPLHPDTGQQIPIRVEGSMFCYSLAAPQHVYIQMVDLDENRDTVVVNTFQEAGEYKVAGMSDDNENGSYVWKFISDSASHMMRIEHGRSELSLRSELSDSGRWNMVATIVDQLTRAENEPIEKRLDSLNLDSIIGGILHEAGIDLSYAYGVISGPGDSLRVVTPTDYRDEVRNSDFRVRLFPQDIFAPSSYLSIYFPERRSHLWGQITPLLVATVILMLIVTACFAYTIRTIYRQQRLATLMVDFINNMTHEFKTPISTVALAAEAIQRPDILREPDRVLHFNQMIRNENRRMRSQTEKILQMAALEENDIDLTLTCLDMHLIIREAVDAISLHVESREGIISCHLDATASAVMADRVHLSNIIHNLLDNANKYSADAPEITVRTFDSSSGIGVRVSDHGIGLSPEDRKHVFDKYFRAPSGNRHDVKGFGIGLSYVKLMVEAHGGTISINSRFGEGSDVEFIMPVARQGTS